MKRQKQISYYDLVSKYNIPFDELFEGVKIIKGEFAGLTISEAAEVFYKKWKTKRGL